MFRLQQPINLDFSDFEKVLVFVPHPDDEAIGCGGLLAKLAMTKAEVKVILVSDGSGGGALPEGSAALREGEFLLSLEILGIKDMQIWGLPDGKLESVSALPQKIGLQIRSYKPNIVMAPWYLDMHPDHSVIGYAVKKYADEGVVDALFYEVWSPLECTHILDITDVIGIKNKAIKCHKTALQYGNYLDGINALATYRGLYLPFERKIKYAEAYNLYGRNRQSWIKKLWQK